MRVQYILVILHTIFAICTHKNRFCKQINNTYHEKIFTPHPRFTARSTH